MLLCNLKTPALVEVVAKNNADEKSQNIGDDVMQRKKVNGDQKNRVANSCSNATNNQKAT
ncbi:MAG: hypothetical protein KGP29_02145 [Proteobacteria bacterium]|nr:hypothetical protein [Pseudomonadota bacterium]